MVEDFFWAKAHSQYITIYYRKSQDELRKLAATRDGAYEAMCGIFWTLPTSKKRAAWCPLPDGYKPGTSPAAIAVSSGDLTPSQG